MSILVTIAVAAAVYLIIDATVDWFTNRGNLALTPQEAETLRAESIDESLLTDVDRKMAEDTKACIARAFGEPATKAIMELDAMERQEASTNLLDELCKLYRVPIKRVTYYRENSGHCGCFAHESGIIYLNIAYLMSNDPACILEYLDTIVHEMRHAVQWSILEGSDVWQTPEETQQSWLNNMVPATNYIRANEDRKGYMTQPVERDAFTFADYALRGVN